VSIAEGIGGNILVNLSTITRMLEKPSDSGKSVIKSIEMEDQGHSIISRGLRKP